MAVYTPVTVAEIHYMLPGENLVKGAEFSPILEDGETLSGSPACSSLPIAGLTISSIQISGTKVKARIEPDADLADTDFELLWSVDTSLGNTRQIKGRLFVRSR